MKGSIVKRGDKYSIVIDVGRDALGNRKQRWFSGFNSRKDAEKELPRILIKLDDGELIDNNNIRFKNFMYDWLEHKKIDEDLSPTTIDGYENIVLNHIIPTLGNLKLQDIKPYNLQKYFDIKSKALSPVTLNNHKRILKSALIYALDMELIPKNPMNKIKAPKNKKEETQVLNIEQSKNLIDEVQHNMTLKTPVTLALLLGLRRGECLGLTWDNIDFQNKVMTINQNLEYVKGKYYFKEPKTKKSKRTIAIPSSVLSILEEHKKWQAEMKLRSGGTWRNEYNLVCTRKSNGLPITPNVLSDSFRSFLKSHKLPVIRFHDLRHTNATLMLAAGVSAKVAGNRLGHSSISITLDLYSHVLESVDKDAADRIDLLINKENVQ